jgi:uncharacterized protein YqjF (DUF2071 family)
MAQVWHDLLFAHWPVRGEVLRRMVPPELVLDTFKGDCWVGVAPFHMSGIRLRGLPAFPGVSRVPELNVRTYVRLEGKPGVYFFSLDAGNFPAVWAARTFYRLPYFDARMRVEMDDDWIAYNCQRRKSVRNRSHGNPGRIEFRGAIVRLPLYDFGSPVAWNTG